MSPKSLILYIIPTLLLTTRNDPNAFVDEGVLSELAGAVSVTFDSLVDGFPPKARLTGKQKNPEYAAASSFLAERTMSDKTPPGRGVVCVSAAIIFRANRIPKYTILDPHKLYQVVIGALI